LEGVDLLMTNQIRIALIPAYEPDSLLIDLLQNVRDAGLKAILVNDGSGSAFSHIFEQAAGFAVILTHPQNYGKGRAIKTGLQYIRNNFNGGYTVVTMDADGQHQISDAVRICAAAQRQPDTLILGSRKLQENVLESIKRSSSFPHLHLWVFWWITAFIVF